MGGVGLTLLGLTLIGTIGVLWWRRHRKQRLVDTHHGVRCPRHDSQAHVTVRTDPGAQSCRQYLRVTTCSLLSDAAVAVPERIAYFPDFPPYKVRLEPARPHPVHATEVSCPQDCVFVLNETAVCATLPPVACTSGVGDSIELVRQTIRNPRISRLLCYYGA
jgi:hypothetical protein